MHLRTLLHEIFSLFSPSSNIKSSRNQVRNILHVQRDVTIIELHLYESIEQSCTIIYNYSILDLDNHL